MVLSFQRTVHNYHSIIFLYHKAQQKIRSSKILLQRVLWFLFQLSLFGESFHLRRFWFHSLGGSCLGHILHAHQYIGRNEHSFLWSCYLCSCFHHIRLGCVYAQAQTICNYRVPSWLIYYFFLTFHCFPYKWYFSMFLLNFFHSCCCQFDQYFEVFT